MQYQKKCGNTSEITPEQKPTLTMQFDSPELRNMYRLWLADGED